MRDYKSLEHLMDDNSPVRGNWTDYSVEFVAAEFCTHVVEWLVSTNIGKKALIELNADLIQADDLVRLYNEHTREKYV
jgi:hypothetical protein